MGEVEIPAKDLAVPKKYQSLNLISVSSEKALQVSVKKRVFAAGGTAFVAEGKLSTGTPTAVKMLRISKNVNKLAACVKLSSHSKFPKTEHSVSSAKAAKEVEQLKQFGSNSFIVKMFGFKHLSDITVICFELCVFPVTNVFKDVKNFTLRTNLVLHIYSPILLALQFLHGNGFIHRDIKKDNILFGPSGIPKLADFGGCLKMDSKEYLDSLEDPFGTPYYGAPEVVTLDRYDYSVDLFGLAVAMANDYAILMLSGMFGGRSWDELIEYYRKKNNTVADSLHHWMKNAVSDRVIGGRHEKWTFCREVILKMLSYNPQDRPKIDEVLQQSVFKEKCEEWAAYTEKQYDQLSRNFADMQLYIIDKCLGSVNQDYIQYCNSVRDDKDSL